jgi:hypothetical protein
MKTLASWLLLQAFFCYLKFAGGTDTPTYSGQLCLFRVHVGACPSPLLWWRVLQVGYCCGLYLFKVHWEDCPSPLLRCAEGILPSLLCVIFSSLFIIQGFLFYFVLFSPRWESDCLEGYAGFILGVAVRVQCATYLLTCWSMSPRLLVAQKPSWCLSVTWCGEALCVLGVWGVGVLLLLGDFSCQVWLQSLSKIFALWSSCYLLPPSSCHLGILSVLILL